MALLRFRLKPLAPFFDGTHTRARKAAALVHSDTLHAALLDVAARIGSPVFGRAETLRVSSVFPSWRDCFFCPKPFLPRPGTRDADAAAGHKRWKSIRFVSEGLLARWLSGEAFADEETEVLPGGLALLRGEMPARGAPAGSLLAGDVVQSVTVDRAGGNATPYQRRGIRVDVAAGGGVWFLAELAPEDREPFEFLLAVLGENGLGGERSVGYGRFDLEGSDSPGECALYRQREDTNGFMTLSLYLPTREEVAAGVLRAPAAYDCALRGGWIHEPAGGDRYKRSLRVCVEGSVFPAVAPAHGEVRDVAPADFKRHPVWRSGLALPVPCRLTQGARP